MFFECLNCVFGATRVKPAIPAHQGTDCQPVKTHEQNKQLIHCARRANNASISPRRARRSAVSMRAETRTTMSRRGSFVRDRRKDSRTMRLTKLRFTAERTNFFPITTPSLAVAAEFGRWSISKWMPRSALRKAKTDENSSVLLNRYSLRKPESSPSGSAISTQTPRRARPFARRARMTARPPRVRMRTRKP